MSDDVQVIECSRCGRLHEVAAKETSIECECGEVLENFGPATTDAVPAEGPADSSSPGLLGRIGKNWRTLSIVGVVLIVGGVLLAFLHSPEPTFGEFKLRGRGSLAARRSRIDIQACLRALEDNARSDEHLAAAAEALQSPEKDFLIERLAEMAFRPELASRELIIRMLGQTGDDRALPVLEKLFQDEDRSIVQLAAGAATLVDSVRAESLLRKHFADPAWAREMLPAVAAVKNDTAARVVGSCLRRPELRVVAMKEIRLSKMKRCIKDLIRLASDRSLFEPDRINAIETLGTFRDRTAHRALANLLEDSKVGWKVRQVLDQNNRL